MPDVTPYASPFFPYADGALFPGEAVRRFGSGILPRAADMEGLIAAIRAPLRDMDDGLGGDLCLAHAGESAARAVQRGYIRGKTVFGCGRSIGDEQMATNGARMLQAETAVLHGAVFSPQTATVLRPGAGFYEPSLVNYGNPDGALDYLDAVDPLYEYGPEREIHLTQAAAGIKTVKKIAMPICGTGFHNFGHFLFDGLPFAFLLSQLIPDVPVIFVGPPLRPWQTEILTALAMADRYVPLSFPTRFARLIVSSTIAQHVAYPSRLIRPLFDTLRFRLAAQLARTRRIFVSRRNHDAKRTLLNRSEVEAALAAMGFEIVTPETMPFEQQVRLFASCDVVIGESGAGMANVAFCDPGTTILEIQPETFFEGWTRATSMLMALEWNVYFARTVDDSARGLTFSVDIPTLKDAVTTILQQMWPNS